MEQDNVLDWCIMLTSSSHLLALVAVYAVVALARKLLSVIVGHINSEDLHPIETCPLRPTKLGLVTCNYGTIPGEDAENGDFRSSDRSDDVESRHVSSSEDLYGGKLCVICYDEQRDCFFVPCGHCATCNICAHKIFFEESKTCPICRRLIGKVKKLPATG